VDKYGIRFGWRKTRWIEGIQDHSRRPCRSLRLDERDAEYQTEAVPSNGGWLDERIGLKATVEIRAGCGSLNVNRLSSGRLRGGYHVRGPVVENMIAVATY